MKAEEKIVAFMFFSVVMQLLYIHWKKKTEFGGGGGGGEGQEQRDRRAKFYWQITGNSSKNNRWGPSIIK